MTALCLLFAPLLGVLLLCGQLLANDGFAQGCRFQWLSGLKVQVAMVTPGGCGSDIGLSACSEGTGHCCRNRTQDLRGGSCVTSFDASCWISEILGVITKIRGPWSRRLVALLAGAVLRFECGNGADGKD